MKRDAKFVIAASLISGVVFLCVGASQEPKSQNPKPAAPAVTTMVTPADVKWVDAPPTFPAGAKLAVLSGDPATADIFCMRAKFPANYKFPAHYHSVAETITVISGTFFVGTGDTVDAAKAKALPSGSFGVIPAKAHHYAFTKEETVVQLNCMGPFDLVYVNPADDPSVKK